jgi:hypothetical protein
MTTLVRLLAVLVAAALVRLAPAQGTSGQLPEPISTAELVKLLDTYVQPRPEQWDAIESLHDDYREAFRTLREGDMEKFLTEDMRKMQGGMPSKAQLDAYLKKMDSIDAKVKELDDRLFDGVAATLDERQQAALPRARDARDRRRSRTLISMAGNQDVDVSDIALASGFTPEQLATIDPQLRSYEQQLTASLRTLSDRTRRMMADVMEAIEKAGFAGLSPEDMQADPAKAQQVMQVVQQAFADAQQRTTEASRALRTLNRKTYAALRGQVAGLPSYAFRHRFLTVAYPEVGSDASGVEKILRSALASRKTDASTREALLSIYEQLVRGDDPAVNEGMDLVDRFNESRNMMQFDQAAYEAFGASRTALREKRAKAAAQYMASIRELLDDERVRQLDLAASTAGDPFARGFDPDAPAEAAAVEDRTATFMDAPGGDAVPEPMGVAEVGSLATGLGLEAGPRAVLEQLHEDYLAKWDAEVGPIGEEYLQAQTDQQRIDADGGPTVDMAAAMRGIEAKRRLRERAEALDAAFLADAAAGLGDEVRPAVELERLARTLSLYGGTSLDYMGFSGAVESPVNIGRLVGFDGSLDAKVAEPARAALLARATALGDAYRSSFLRSLDIERLNWEIRGEYERAMRDAAGNPPTAAAQEMGRRWQDLSAEVERIKKDRAKILRDTFDAMLVAVPEGSRDRMQLAFDRVAYPSVYRDSRSALPFIERAEAFGDLDAKQREQLTALKEKYSRDYLDACRRMTPQGSSLEQAPKERFEAYMALENQRAKVRFERDERSVRAVSQLKRILTPEQVARIPALAGYMDRLQDGDRAMGAFE